MAEGVAFSFLEKLAELMVDPIVRQFSYLFLYNNNIKNLEKELKRLQAAREGVEFHVCEAKFNLETIDPDVNLWLVGVDEIEMKASTVIGRWKFNVEKMYLNLRCLNVKQRYLISRRARKLIDVIGKHKRDGDKYAKLTHSASHLGIVTSDRESRKSIVEQVMEALNDDRISMIGICGIGGVGKTTMANDVCRRAKAQGLFEEFAMTSVSQTQDLLKIQKELAHMLGLYFVEEDTIFLRAQRLHERLSKGRKILVILDDVWHKLSLQEVGIPTGCKVICTSRNLWELWVMGFRKIFDVGVLTEKESWDLFEANAGNFDDINDQHVTAKKIVKKCRGLPIAIVTLAKALKNKEKREWDNALHHLKESTEVRIHGMDKHVYKCIELSYKFQKDGARTLLLLCCLCPEDTNIWVETLARFKYLPASSEAVTKDEVRTLVGDLISSNLLIADEDERRVKVHDVVREVCFSIEGLNKLEQNRVPSIVMVNRSFTPRKLAFYEEAGSQAFKQVMDALAHDQICTIGILGKAGVGKRTLLNEVVEKVKENELFDDVAMTKAEVVSKMQGDLAEMLGLVFDMDTERAKQLRERLTDGRKTLIIINYGVWNKDIDLEKVGIPVGSEHNKGCKVAIVSRDAHVCENIESEKIVGVEPLSSEEALVLLRKHAGRSDEGLLEPIAKQIVEKCEGQPWAIVILGEALKNQDENIWLDARDHLLKCPNNVWLNIIDLLKGPYSGRWIICAVEFSYSQLSSREAQILLLLICIMGDTTIETLVVMCVEKLKLFKDVKEGDLELELEAARDKVIDLLQELHTRFLLQIDVDKNTVSVHELVRIACL